MNKKDYQAFAKREPVLAKQLKTAMEVEAGSSVKAPLQAAQEALREAAMTSYRNRMGITDKIESIEDDVIQLLKRVR